MQPADLIGARAGDHERALEWLKKGVDAGIVSWWSGGLQAAGAESVA